ncbi:MAG: threonylcarbamoyl-AMP synthase [Candidatus Cloacimonetes bacterium 4572_55]|nr:MAG: threonylcarbamoyl-AMP synthase [Candidatus Cloacimonetes bacterium 4572_55]
MLLPIHPGHPPANRIKRVVSALSDGKIVIYPTDTVYGMGCSMMNKKAIGRIYQLKGLKKSHPVSFICSDLSHISEYAEISNYAFRILRRLLPGPYTFVLPGSRKAPRLMLTRRKTVGIRIPECLVAVRIVEGLGHPIVSTSVIDRNGRVMDDPREIERLYRNDVAVVIDSGLSGIVSSSVVDLTTNEPVVLREGKGDVSLFE